MGCFSGGKLKSRRRETLISLVWLRCKKRLAPVQRSIQRRMLEQLHLPSNQVRKCGILILYIYAGPSRPARSEVQKKRHPKSLPALADRLPELDVPRRIGGLMIPHVEGIFNVGVDRSLAMLSPCKPRTTMAYRPSDTEDGCNDGSDPTRNRDLSHPNDTTTSRICDPQLRNGDGVEVLGGHNGKWRKSFPRLMAKPFSSMWRTHPLSKARLRGVLPGEGKGAP